MASGRSTVTKKLMPPPPRPTPQPYHHGIQLPALRGPKRDIASRRNTASFPTVRQILRDIYTSPVLEKSNPVYNILRRISFECAAYAHEALVCLDLGIEPLGAPPPNAADRAAGAAPRQPRGRAAEQRRRCRSPPAPPNPPYWLSPASRCLALGPGASYLRAWGSCLVCIQREFLTPCVRCGATPRRPLSCLRNRSSISVSPPCACSQISGWRDGGLYPLARGCRARSRIMPERETTAPPIPVWHYRVVAGELGGCLPRRRACNNAVSRVTSFTTIGPTSRAIRHGGRGSGSTIPQRSSYGDNMTRHSRQ